MASSAGQRDAARRARRSIRSCSADFLSQDSGAVNVNNFDIGNSTRGPHPQHRRLPVQPDRPEQPRPVRVHASTTSCRPSTGSRASTATSRRSTIAPTSTSISPDRPLVFTELRPEAVCRLAWRWIGSVEFPERAARRRQPRAGAVRERLGLSAATCSTTRRSASSIRSAAARGERHRLPAAGPLHEHVSDQRQRLADARQPRAPDGRQLAANHVNPYNFAGAFPQVTSASARRRRRASS